MIKGSIPKGAARCAAPGGRPAGPGNTTKALQTGASAARALTYVERRSVPHLLNVEFPPFPAS
ncbi:MAG: hypothetical protein ACJ789_17255 [Thermomicrobiales bacterium]|jgi:hypothetical protein